MRFIQLSAQISKPVRGDTRKQIGSYFTRQAGDNLGAVVQPRLVKDLDSALGKEPEQYRCRNVRGQIVQGSGND